MGILRSGHASSARNTQTRLARRNSISQLLRRTRRGLTLEPLEQRFLMAVLGPQLVSIDPDVGPDLLLGQDRLEAPRELTFRFNAGQAIDPVTLGAIQILRGGEDGLVNGIGDVAVRPGFVGIGNFPNEVILRFRETLPQDQYQITVVGTDPAPLRNTAGLPFRFDTISGIGADQVVTMDLDLGPRVVAVVPQPVDRNPTTGALTQRLNEIEVYFDHRDPLNPALANNPALYQLILTNDTATTGDDVIRNPDGVTPVSYDPATGKAVLRFSSPIGAGTFRLRIGDALLGPGNPLPTPASPPIGADPGDSFTTSFPLGMLTNQSQVISGQAIDPRFLPLQLPGGNDEPGHRQIPDEFNETHVSGASGTFQYNFQNNYGFDPQGNVLSNGITEAQKQRVREVFQIYSHYFGVQFVETAASGFTIATGDMRAVDDDVPTGPGGVAGIAGGSTAVMDNAENWGNSEFGGFYFQTAMHEIGHLLGLEHATDLPELTLLSGMPGIFGNTGEGVFPGDHDIVHGQYLYPPDSTDIDLYQFTLTQAGMFSAETFAERLTTTSRLDSVLTLYGDVHVLTAKAGSSVSDTHTFMLTDGATTVTFEFDLNDDVQPGNFAIRFKSTDTAEQVAQAIADAIRGVASLDVDPVVEFNRVLLRGGSMPIVMGPTQSSVTSSTQREIIARNDDYYSEDSLLQLRLNAGNYYLAVTSTGNTAFDPARADSGFGGTTEGRYDLRINFTATPATQLRDATGRVLDGDADGRAGGTFDFWFQGDAGNTIWVDKASLSATEDGSIGNPYKTIAAAFSQAQLTPGQDLVRIVGNAGADKDFATLQDNLAYEIGFKQEVVGNQVVETPLADGATFEVPHGVTVMVDAGAIFKLRSANLDVGSSSQGANADRSESYLQILGTPQLAVHVTSFHNELIGNDTFAPVTNAVAGDFGGIVFRNDIDIADGRALLERQGIFLNYVNHADISYGGGNVVVNSQTKAYAPIHAIVARPTLTYNTITQSKDAAISADQQSFADTRFQLSTGGISGASNAGPITITTEDDHGLLTGAQVMITGVLGNTAANSTWIVTVTGPRTFTLNGSVGNGAYIASAGDRWLEVDPVGDPVQFAVDYERVGPHIRGNILLVERSRGTSSEIQSASNAGPISITTDNPHGLVTGQAVRIFGVQGNTAANGIFTIATTGPNTFTLDGSMGNGGYVPGVSDNWQLVTGGSITTATNAGPVEINTGTPHGLLTGARVRIANVQGNTAANGDWTVTVTGLTTFTLDGSTGSGAYVASGLDSWLRITGTGITNASNSSPITITTDTPHGLITGSRVRVSGVQGNTAANGDFTVTVTGPNTFTLDGSGGNSAYIPSENDEWIAITDNSINGLFVRIDTPFGSGTNRLTVAARWDDLDIVHVLTENLIIQGTPGGPLDTVARLDARLAIDPGLIVKLEGARIETEIGARFLAEGTADRGIVFTSLRDDRYGIGGSFDTNRNLNGAAPARGNWGGFFFGPTSSASIDHAVISYAGGSTRIEGGFDNFNAVAIHQADVRLTNSVLENNLGGLANTVIAGQPAGNRNGRGTNESATIFVRGAQPIIVGNTIRDNTGDAININANALQSRIIADPGRSTGRLENFTHYGNNHGPLVRDNRLADNGLNGMEVRGATLTTESVWDDVDIVHVLLSEIIVENLHTFGGLRLESSADQSLVVKLFGATAGFTAGGRPLDIDDRIGGTVHVVGTPGHPVILTSLRDDTVGAGLDTLGQLQKDTDNLNQAPAAGNWRSVRLTQHSNDRNSAFINELEGPSTNVGDPRLNINATLNAAQFLGDLAPNEKSGDDNRRLGFEVQGFISLDHPGDVDVYSFTAPVGSEVWFDIDRTTHALDTVIELVEVETGNPNGQVVARSDDSAQGQATSDTYDGSGFISNTEVVGNLGRTLIRDSFLGRDFYTSNTLDAGMRVILEGAPGTTKTYFVRVRSANSNKDNHALTGGATKGAYRLQVRLNQVDEFPGSTVRYADLRYAGGGTGTTGAIEVLGLPNHSPLTGQTVETRAANDTFAQAQPLGNLLGMDRNSISVGGTLSAANEVDWYQFTIDYDLIQSIPGYSNGGLNEIAWRTFATMFDIDYADGISRPDTTLSVFDSAGNLILVSRDSNITDDQPGSGQGSDVDDLTRGSVGKFDPFIGTVQMPAGVIPGGISRTYFVAISSNSHLPLALNATYQASAANPLIRLEPINSVRRIAEDRIGIQGFFSGRFEDEIETHEPENAFGGFFGDQEAGLFDIRTTTSLQTHVLPFSLDDVTLFVSQSNRLRTVNPFTGLDAPAGAFAARTDIAAQTTIQDIVMRSDGRLFGYRSLTAANTAGALVEIDPGTGAATVIGNDGIPDFDPATNPINLEQLTTNNVDALAFERTGNAPSYNLFYSVRGARRPAQVTSGTSTLYRADPGTGSAAFVSGSFGRKGEIFASTEGDIGVTTGMAFIGGTLYGVSDTGKFYTINTGNGRATVIATIAGAAFTGLTLGPQNVEGGAFANILFATTSNRIYALNASGVLQPIFSGGVTNVGSESSLTGLAFTPADYNLWHPTMRRRADAGHGIVESYDFSRSNTILLDDITGGDSTRNATYNEGGASFYFGLEEYTASGNDAYFRYQSDGQFGVVNEVSQDDLTSNANIGNNYNVPGGAMGSLVTNSFSLSGYDRDDKPTLYFNYFLNTQNANDGDQGTGMRDSARVFVSSNNGTTWSLLATNNSVLSNTVFTNELPRFLSASADASNNSQQRVQELFDNTGGWRQARVDLGDFVGNSNLKIRFDFSTAGEMNQSGLLDNAEDFGNFTSPQRGQNNAFEGFYVDDIIIGFAERGEMVVAGNNGQNTFFQVPQNPQTGASTEVLVGAYQLEIRRGTEYAHSLSQIFRNVVIDQQFNTNTRFVGSQFRLGDSNVHRDQGQILIEANTVSDTLGFGIAFDAAARAVSGNLPFPGGVRNLRELNQARLAPSIVIENNLLFRNSQGGISFSGDPNAGTSPLAPVPFGRILNNTIFGNTARQGTGISVTQNASPTVLNNIVSNLVTGVLIDATSQTAGTVLGATLYKNNTTDANAGASIGLGTFPLQLALGDPLFVDPLVVDTQRGNFYLAAGSQAIDASVISLEDRPEMILIANPLGIPESPIFAPTRDLLGNPRIDDPTVSPPFFGLGENPFTDRGALERVNTITISDVILPEEISGVASVFQFVVQLARSSGDIVTVMFATADGTAAVGADYVGRNGVLTFNPGESTKLVTVQVLSDLVDEIDETFFVNLTGATNAVLADPQAVGTITDNDTPPNLLISGRTLPEGNSGTTNFVFDLSLSTPSGRAIPVVFNAQNGTATTGNMDFLATSGTVTFAPGTVTQKVTVQVVGDAVVEGSETFSVSVTVPGATPPLVGSLPAAASGVILDDDTKVSIANPAINVTEGTNPPNPATQQVVFLVTIPGPSTQQVTVPFTTVDGLGFAGATAGSDYVATSGTLTFAPGSVTERITVVVNADSTSEADESFTIELGTPTNGILDPAGNSVGTVTLANDDGPPIASIGNVPAAVENAGTISFPVMLSAPSGLQIVVTFDTINGTATAGSDFVGVTAGAVTFAPGETSKDAVITLIDDALVEVNETFSVMLTGPMASLGSSITASGTILDNEPRVVIRDASGSEASGGVVFNIDVIDPITGSPTTNATDVVFSYSTSSPPGTATSGVDYVDTAAVTITLIAGQTRTTVTVPVINDALDENDETFTITLSGGQEIFDNQATGTIVDDDPLPTVSVNSRTVMEGDVGQSAMVFTVTLTPVSGRTATIAFATASNTAVAALDFVGTSGVLTFTEGETAKEVTVQIIGDTLGEPNESFFFTLSNPVNAVLGGAGTGTGTITDDEPRVSITPSPATIVEGDVNPVSGNFTVLLSNSSTQQVTVVVQTVPQTATAGVDYQSINTTLTFAPGETTKVIGVNVLADLLNEFDETFQVVLSQSTNSLINVPTANVTIDDNDPLPQLAIGNASVVEGDAGTVTAVLTVTLTPVSGRNVTVAFATAADTAASPGDYAAASGLLTFTPSSTQRQITVTVNGDSISEGDEQFFVNLSMVDFASFADSQGVVTIIDDEPKISIESKPFLEGDSGLRTEVFNVTLDKPSSAVITVNYQVVTDPSPPANNGAATAGVDFQATTGTITFDPGQTARLITVQTLGDLLDEHDETFRVALSGAVNASIIPGGGVGTIIDNDPLPSLSISQTSVLEGDGPQASEMVFTVTLSPVSGREVTVAYSTADGSAISGSDYTTAQGTLTFAPGETTRQVTVQVTGDGLPEPNETFFLGLSNVTNANNAPSPGIATIVDDEPRLSISDVTALEGVGMLVFDVTLSKPSSTPITVDFNTLGGIVPMGTVAATAGTDYTTASGSLSFGIGQTLQQITVQVNTDALDEADEAFLVQLSNAGTTPITRPQALGTILDDDPLPQVSILPLSVFEGDSGTTAAVFTVMLSAASGRPITADYATVAGSALAGNDFNAASGQVSLAPGATTAAITVPIRGDLVNEIDETFSVSLANVTNATIASGSALGTIRDDDATVSILDAGIIDEGNSGQRNAEFTVQLSKPTGDGVVVTFTTVGGTAQSNVDFIATSGTLSFGPNETEKKILVPVLGDTSAEGNETFSVNLAIVGNSATPGDLSGLATIRDDDLMPVIFINDVTVTEDNIGAAMAVLTVTLSSSSGQTVTVNVSTSDGSATAASGDYQPIATTLTFMPGQTSKQVSIAIGGDLRSELNETINVTLSSPSFATLGDSLGVVTIVDNDPQHFLVTGADAGGGPHVRVFNGLTGAEQFSFFAYNTGFTGGVRVASADVNGDGQPDIITVPGRTGGPHVRVFDGKTGAPIRDFFAFEPTYTGGLNVAAGDVNGDGRADLILATEGGAGESFSRVRVFNGATGALIQEIPLAAGSGFQAGVRVAAGDITGDGRADIILAAAPGQLPRVAVLDGFTGNPVADFLAYGPGAQMGFYVASGDFNGDGRTDIMTGAGAGGGPHVRVFNGVGVAANTPTLLADFFAYNAGFVGGVRVGATEWNGDGVADLIVAAGPGGGPHVRVLSGPGLTELASFFAYGSFTGGVQVGGSFRTPGAPLMAAGGPSPGTNASALTIDQVRPLVNQAISNWAAAGLDERLLSRLSEIEVRIADLPAGYLGMAYHQAIVLDDDAAGLGWFVDSTPMDDAEFELLAASGLQAHRATAASQGVDLLTVLAHELGHTLGLADLHEQVDVSLMSERLGLGVRRHPTALEVDALFEDDGAK